jgi:uncharacterized protein YyaL (SSP411 family)
MPNRLAHETSPYLQQHAENPVDWYAWGPEALAESKKTGKPILLSVGYSACHWCHVMAHESFEDAGVARLMNELFVNIKVDREERPDIDQIYQAAQAMLTQRNGGWPLTMFLTPDQVPFFGGTYFPKSARYGLPGFGDLLQRVRHFYDENAAEIATQNRELVSMLDRTRPSGRTDPSTFTRAPIEAAVQSLEGMFDGENGGFGGAPKFPHPDSIELLLRHHASTHAENSRLMAEFTLVKMAEGGIYDHVGGGFARYSVDERWAIPHFEKMLYDNGWLLRLYAEAWAATRNPLFERICAQTAAWVMREMQSPEGGYYSSLDADSEGEEGKFYVWTADEVRALLDPSGFAVASAAWGLDRAPNFEGRHWHLVTARSTTEVARALDMDEDTVRAKLDAARTTLRAEREKRVRPGRDEKILTSWNALMIAGMARAGRVFAREDWIASARAALEFIRGTLWSDGKLLATCRAQPQAGTGSNTDRAHLDAYLDDHAYLLAALLEMMQADFRAGDVDWATEIGDLLLGDFEDRDAGGFFFTAHHHEPLIHRPKSGADNATPSGNGVAAWALNRLSFLTGEVRFSEPAARTLGLFWTQINRHPSGFGSLLAALDEQLDPARTVIVRGGARELAPWRELLDTAFLPTTLCLYLPPDLRGLPPVLSKPAGDGVNAWVCEGVTCLPPLASLEELRAALELPKMPGPSQASSISRSRS